MQGMVWIAGGTFQMGSDHHYAEEAPAHRATVDGFWIDPAPVTNREFLAFVEATGHVTVAEQVPNAADYPGALPHMLRAGSLVFSPPPSVANLDNAYQWWSYPSLSVGGRVRSELALRARLELVKDLYYELSYLRSHDNRPPTDAAGGLDWSLVSSLTYKF